MKGVKFEIPVWSILLVIILFGGGYFLVRGINKNKENAVNVIQQKYDSTRIVNNILKSELTDTIDYYERIILAENEVIKTYRAKVSEKEVQLKKIKSTVAKFTSDTVYQLTQEYLPEPSDSSKYAYSGNQVKEIYTEHLESLDMIELLLDYRTYSGDLNIGIRQRDLQLDQYKKLIELHQSDLEQQSSLNSQLLENNSQLNKKVKTWKILTPSAGVVGVVIGILIVL